MNINILIKKGFFLLSIKGILFFFRYNFFSKQKSNIKKKIKLTSVKETKNKLSKLHRKEIEKNRKKSKLFKKKFLLFEFIIFVKKNIVTIEGKKR